MSKSYGRDRERASVLRFLSAPGGLLAIDGPPCAGKSLLLREAVDAARDRGYAVTPVDGGVLRDRVDLARLLDRTAERPLLAVDHAHRDPAAVLALLPELARRRVTALFALTGAHATGELRDALAGHVLALAPVDADVVAGVLAELLDVPPGPDLAALVASAGGDPRLVAELVLGLREEDLLDTSGGTAGLRADRLPRRVTTVVGCRVEALSAKATQLLRVAAVLGRSFPLRDVAELMGETTAALLLSVDEVIASGLVGSVDRRLEFVSDLVWRAVVEAVPEAVRHALRQDAAGLRRVPEPAVTADRAAGVVRDVRALAASGSLGSAVALARHGLARGLPASAAAELRTALTGILLADGRPAAAAAEAEHALAAPAAPQPLRNLAAAGRLLARYLATGGPAGAHALSVLTAPDRTASDADVVMAATVHSCLEWSAGHLAEGLYWGRESTRWELDQPTAWWQSHAAVAYAMKLSALGRFADAEALVRGDGPEVDEAVAAGAPTARLIARARVLAQAGRLVQAHVAAHSGLAAARDRGLRLLVPLASTVLATVALLRGDVPAAAEHVRRYGSDLAGGGAVAHSGQCEWVELLLAHARDGAPRAAELARARLADAACARRVLVDEPGAAAWLVRLARSVDDRALAEAAVGAAEELAAANPGLPAVVVGAGHARALLGRDEEGLLAAADGHAHPWAEAAAHEDVAGLLAETGRAERSAAHVALASRIYARMGADGEVGRLRRAGGEWRRLSAPERDIARLVGAGLTNRQVARQLYLSPHTVNYHLRGIFKKLGISSRVELARLAHAEEHAEV
ncbi:LuxR C-terminal-related transcriptional regulator [Saccharothrix obliqua]|uniref:LuxR C-terminal-related transcriptional regulator n=1 Tax=Saccharothrix obliqua TaxID=2861747 RepID=UPI001C5E37B8|nr:LuxR family transcriptional regulator [Saccharothrix obliqua]MBW4720964.1 LuxR C-terminal-related transcriptional regulator [Saccharothrix obliqua]